MCVACGGDGQPCCDGFDRTRCGPDLVCDSDFFGGTCTACGGDGEPCCPGRVCDADLACGGFEGTCGPCGALDEPCCADGVCDSPLTCEFGGGSGRSCQNP
jgi:hypothetical protein